MSEELRATDLVERNPLPHAVPIKDDVFVAMKEAADSKGWSAADQINLALRQWLGWER